MMRLADDRRMVLTCVADKKNEPAAARQATWAKMDPGLQGTRLLHDSNTAHFRGSSVGASPSSESKQTQVRPKKTRAQRQTQADAASEISVNPLVPSQARQERKRGPVPPDNRKQPFRSENKL